MADEKPMPAERGVPFETSSGRPVEAAYTPESLNGFDYLDELGFPGEYPYTRGVQPTMYRGRFWTVRQYAGFSDAEESNRRYKYLLSQGQTGISVAFDLPTQIGYDPDHPMAEGEVGKVGVSIASIEDMEALFRDIPLETVTTSMTINATASVLLALYVAVAKKQGADLAKVGGTTQNDILKEYIARGTYIYPPRESLRLITDVFAWCSENLPQWNTISISGYHMREAGCTAAQEVGFTIANAIAYTEAALARGLAIDDFAPRLAFFFACHSNFLEEIAKFRAARRLWARTVTERFGAKKADSMKLRFHTQTGGATLTAQQPVNNLVRTALQGMSAVLGGTQSLHTNSYDEALSLPSQHAAELALRTQQIIAHETGVGDTIDPVAGSWYIEHLTDEVERDAADYVRRIDEMGGALAAVERGFQAQEVHENAFRIQRDIEAHRKIVVGVNEYVDEEGPPQSLHQHDPTVGKRRVEQIRRLRAERDAGRAEASLRRLEEVARGSENTVPVLIECVESYVTLGEIASRLRAVWGEQRERMAL
ncbi:MAG: methylmalonyl-CoA mutase family protein [Dehalococcoidia bacterium]